MGTVLSTTWPWGVAIPFRADLAHQVWDQAPLSTAAWLALARLCILLISFLTHLHMFNYALVLYKASVSARAALPVLCPLPGCSCILCPTCTPHQLTSFLESFLVFVSRLHCYNPKLIQGELTSLCSPSPSSRAGRNFVFGGSWIFLKCYLVYVLHISHYILSGFYLYYMLFYSGNWRGFVLWFPLSQSLYPATLLLSLPGSLPSPLPSLTPSLTPFFPSFC